MVSSSIADTARRLDCYDGSCSDREPGQYVNCGSPNVRPAMRLPAKGEDVSRDFRCRTYTSISRDDEKVSCYIKCWTASDIGGLAVKLDEERVNAERRLPE